MEQPTIWERVEDFLGGHLGWVFFWFFASIAIGLVASARGRSLPAWFGISLATSPFLAFILAMFVLPPIRTDD